MSSNNNPLSGFLPMAGIFVGGVVGSLILMFAISSIVDAIYYGGSTEVSNQMAKEEPHKASEPAQEAEATKEQPSEAPKIAEPATPAEEKPAETETAAANPDASAGEQSFAAMLAAANIKKGQRAAKKCVACHTFEKDGKNKVGPNLYGILGKKIAARDDFSYSPAMKNYAASAGTWNYENLRAYLIKPRKVVPKGKMAFAGLKKNSDQVNILAYLRTLADEPQPLPAE